MSKKLALISIFVVLAALAAGFVVPVREDSIQVPAHTANAGELTGEVLVGQTFVAERDNLSAVSVMFATYSGRDNTQPVEFYLREGVGSDNNLRTAIVDPSVLGDNQFYRFDFEPIADSAGKTYFFFVRSPGSAVGNAVTADLHTEDPYHQGSAYIARGLAGGYDAGLVARSGKPSVDVVFGTAYSVPASTATWHAARDAVRHFMVTWDQARSTYVIWAKVGLMAGLAVVLSLAALRLPRNHDKAFLGLLLALALTFRIMYAVELPLTNDEGNYLYDARTLLEGKLAGGDGYVKAPLVVAWVALWSFLDQSIIAGRMSSVLVGALTLLPLYFLTKSLAGKKSALTAAALWAVLGVTTVFNIYVHTQSLAIFFGVSGLALLALTLRRELPDKARYFVWAGVLLGLGVVSRKSILALGLVPLALILLESPGWNLRLKRLLQVGAGFAIVLAFFLAFAGLLYGPEGVLEAAGFNSAEDGITAVDPAEVDQVRAYSLRGMTPFFRESLPVILLAVIGLGVALEGFVGAAAGGFLTFLAGPGESGSGMAPALVPPEAGPHAHSGAITRSETPPPYPYWHEYLITKLVWVIPLAVFWWAWSFFAEYEGSSVMVFGMEKVWYAMAAVGLLFAVLPRQVGSSKTRLDWRRPLMIASTGSLWVAGLVIFYMNWIKFHANYIGEFLPPLVLLAGVAVPAMWSRLSIVKLSGVKWAAGVLALGVTLWTLFISNYVTFFFEHTGTFDQGAVKEAAVWARDNIPSDEPIFTGAAVVPYLSGHRVALDIAHPRWYAYEFTRKDTQRLNTFLPPAEEMVQAFRDAEWFLMDSQTGFSFLMEYSEIEAGLENDFESIKGISNGSNTLTFYKRVIRD